MLAWLALIAGTEQALPKVMLKDLTDKDQDDPGTITYKWEPPAEEECDNFNAELGYFFYKITGSSEWNKDYFKEDNLSLSSTDLTISNLLPFSLYQLELFISTRDGQFSPTALRNKRLTGPSQPHQPTKLRISSNILKWEAPYPPTGQLNGYEVRWKHSNSADESEWEISDYLAAGEVSCGDTLGCYQVEGLESNKNYSFQVRAFNLDVEDGSSWSVMVSYMDTDSDFTTSMVVIVVSMVTLLVLVILLVVFLVHKCNICNRIKGFKRTMTDDYSFRPIIRDSNSRLSSVSRFTDLRKPPPTTPLSITLCLSG